jgi:hypothetical protein
MTERGIEALLSQGLMRHAITPLRIHVAADARAAEYGVVAASEKTKVERTVIAGFTASRWGLVIGIARQVHFGALPAGTRKASEAVSAAIAGFWARTLPGTPVAEIVAAAAADYRSHGFTPAVTAGSPGGAVGYGREWFACAESKRVIQSGQAFAWRAFASPAGAEDTILVVGDRLEVLTEIRGWPVNEARSQGRVYRTPAILTF